MVNKRLWVGQNGNPMRFIAMKSQQAIPDQAAARQHPRQSRRSSPGQAAAGSRSRPRACQR